MLQMWPVRSPRPVAQKLLHGGTAYRAFQRHCDEICFGATRLAQAPGALIARARHAQQGRPRKKA